MTVHVNKNGKLEYLTGQVVPKVGNLFIDKLYMTCNIPSQLHEATIAKFHEAVSNGNAYKVSKTIYKHNIKLSTADEGDILIQCQHNNPKYNFFRLEFNPAKANLNHLKTQLDHILTAIGGYTGLLTHGIVTRIDFTVEALYIGPTDILARYPDMVDESHYAKNGSIESKYLGASSSSKQVLLYDKPAQIAESNKKKPKGLKAIVPDHKMLRIEIKLTNTKCTLKDMELLPNPFLGLTLTAYPEAKSMKTYDPLWSLFLSACRYEGVDNALLHFNEQDQETYKKRLITEGRTEWWDPVKVWQGLSSAISIITNVKGFTPSLQTIS